MDIISHGLYGGVAFGRRSRISYARAFFFGVMPDLFSFGIFFAVSILTLSSGADVPIGPHDPTGFPLYVYTLYNVTHSLVVACGIFGLVWLFRGKVMKEMLAWPLHILIDIPTHASGFFPTPFLWPLSDTTVSGVSWGHPYIFIPNVIILTVLYIHFFIRKRSHRHAHEHTV